MNADTVRLRLAGAKRTALVYNTVPCTASTRWFATRAFRLGIHWCTPTALRVTGSVSLEVSNFDLFFKY